MDSHLPDIEILEPVFSVCRVADYSGVDPDRHFSFTGCTDQEKSLVCPTESVPENTVRRDDGWRAFRICGELDFSLIGILSRIADILASRRIGILAISTYNTDYILTRAGQFDQALSALKEAGYTIRTQNKDETEATPC